MRAALCAGAVLVGHGADLARAGSSAQLLVTARVVNRCTIELPERLPERARPANDEWRRWLNHRCDLPVEPRVSVAPLTGGADAAAVDWTRRGRHFVVTVTY